MKTKYRIKVVELNDGTISYVVEKKDFSTHIFVIFLCVPVWGWVCIYPYLTSYQEVTTFNDIDSTKNYIDILIKNRQEEEAEQLALEVIQHKGTSHQMDMIGEEFAEVIQAINKVRRAGGISFEGVIKPFEGSSIEYCKLYWDLCGEIADAKIMIAQAELMLSKEAIDLSVERKLQRLERRLK